MKIEIKSKIHEPLLERDNVNAEIEYDVVTPSRDNLKKELSKKLGVNEELVVVERISTNYGNKQANVKVFVYKDSAKVLSISTKKYSKKNTKKEDSKEEVKAEVKKEI